jgi:hypothetical protein
MRRIVLVGDGGPLTGQRAMVVVPRNRSGVIPGSVAYFIRNCPG